jgi:hypothetical protein
MMHSVEMGSGAMIYVPIFIKIVSANRMLIRDTRRYRDIDIIVIA